MTTNNKKEEPRVYGLEVVKGPKIIPVLESTNWDGIAAMQKVSEAELSQYLKNPSLWLKRGA